MGLPPYSHDNLTSSLKRNCLLVEEGSGDMKSENKIGQDELVQGVGLKWVRPKT